jgi:hypothetical protein
MSSIVIRKAWAGETSVEEKPRTNPHQKSLQRGIMVLLTLVIVEGLLRKIFPFLSVPLFFAKDFVVLYLGLKASLGKLPEAGERIFSWQIALLVLMLPCILDTTIRDPILGAFGTKQYCLFPFVGVAFCAAYLPDQGRELAKLLKFLALSIVATSALAMLESRLPPGHWLNLTPEGESLAGFSAGGKLRVSSSFVFVAQYCMYLNGMVGILASFIMLRKVGRSFMDRLLPVIILCFFIIGVFITGSRTAVVGTLAITVAGSTVLLFGSGAAKAVRVFMFLGIAFVGYLAMHVVFPDAFVVFEARSQGSGGSNQEVMDRIVKGLVDWTGAIKTTPVLGNGLGIQSNGSERLSPWAALMKDRWGWRETDQLMVLFEGGIYLVTIWYSFRLFVVCYTGLCMLQIRDPLKAASAAFCWGVVVVEGVVGTLSIQPPLTIWWWTSIGLILCLREYDKMAPSLKGQIQTYARDL